MSQTKKRPGMPNEQAEAVQKAMEVRGHALQPRPCPACPQEGDTQASSHPGFGARLQWGPK